MYFRLGKQKLIACLLTATFFLVAFSSALQPAAVSTAGEDAGTEREYSTLQAFGRNTLASMNPIGGASGPYYPNPLQAPGFRDQSEYMIGTVAVGVILLESNGAIDTQTENWAAGERTNVQNEIQAAMNWWAGRATANGVTLTFTIDWTNLNAPIGTSYEPINRPGPAANGQALWIAEAMTSLGFTSFTSYFDNVRDYNDNLRTTHNTDWAFTMFIVDSSNDANNRFTDNWFAYAYLGGPFQVMTYGNNGWGIGNMDRVGAHETGHIFYALDEYAASGCSPTDRSGYLNRLNSNCINGGTGAANIMLANTVTGASPRVETREQIGWRDTDSDGIEDILDTFPTTSLNAYTPDPSFDTTPTYSGSSIVVPMTNSNPFGPGNDVTTNTIANVQYNVDGGSWSGATASDGTFDEDIESFTFTTSALSTGLHTICARATNSVGNVGGSSCDTLTIGDVVPPDADAGSDQTVGEGWTVTFNGGGSTDNVGIVSYEWDIDAGDGVSFSPPDKTGVSPTHIYGDNGVFTVTLRVKDAAGNSDTDTMTVTVNNAPPTVVSLPPLTMNEGQTAIYIGQATDPGSDDLTFTWTWQSRSACDKTTTYFNNAPANTPDPFPSPDVNPSFESEIGSCQYGDNGVFTLTLQVCDDDGGCMTVTTIITVVNVLPSVDPLPNANIVEGQTVFFIGHATDPGSDDLTFTWTWQSRSSCDKTTTYFNNAPTNTPDPFPSPSVNPMDETESANCQYGDNGIFTVTLQVCDDDGACSTVTSHLTVVNIVPSVDPLPNVTIWEGQTASFTGHATDPGSDDLTFTWTWPSRSACDKTTTYFNNAPTNTPDPFPSPSVNPMDITESASCQYGDNGVFTITLQVCDDDGACSTVTAMLTVINTVPTVVSLPPLTMNEGQTAMYIGQATDPGSDDLTFTWTWQSRSVCDKTTTYFSNAPTNTPDPFPSPDVIPSFESEIGICQYGDNGVFTVTLQVCDDDGGCTTVMTTITVNNVAPTASIDHVYVDVYFDLLVTGEKWHNVSVDIYENGTLIDSQEIERYPGNPNTQALSFITTVDILQTHSLVVTFDANADGNPVNGQINGANPVWLTIDGTTLKRTFVVSQGGPVQTWTIANLDSYIVTVNKVLTFVASGNDPGSDDLRFDWDFGDTTTVSKQYYNDQGNNPPPGVGSPDPFPSPGGTFPFSAQDASTHTYTTAGTYTVTLDVTDDDGGTIQVQVTLTIQ